MCNVNVNVLQWWLKIITVSAFIVATCFTAKQSPLRVHLSTQLSLSCRQMSKARNSERPGDLLDFCGYLAHVNHQAEGHRAQQLPQHPWSRCTPWNYISPGPNWPQPGDGRPLIDLPPLFLLQFNPGPIPIMPPMECHTLPGTGHSPEGVRRRGATPPQMRSNSRDNKPPHVPVSHRLVKVGAWCFTWRFYFTLRRDLRWSWNLQQGTRSGLWVSAYYDVTSLHRNKIKVCLLWSLRWLQRSRVIQALVPLLLLKGRKVTPLLEILKLVGGTVGLCCWAALEV